MKKLFRSRRKHLPQKTTKDEMEREIRLENARYEYELSKIQSDYSLNTFKYKNIISSYVYLVTHTESELSSEIRSINQQISELKGKIKSSSNSLEPWSSIQRGKNMDYQLQIQHLATKLEELKREQSYYSAISNAKKMLVQYEQERDNRIEQENAIHQENVQKIKSMYNYFF